MDNNINISKNIINNYKNNIEILQSLKLKIKSGSCSLYDIALYSELVKANSNDKKLRMSI